MCAHCRSRVFVVTPCIYLKKSCVVVLVPKAALSSLFCLFSIVFAVAPGRHHRSRRHRFTVRNGKSAAAPAIVPWYTATCCDTAVASQKAAAAAAISALSTLPGCRCCFRFCVFPFRPFQPSGIVSVLASKTVNVTTIIVIFERVAHHNVFFLCFRDVLPELRRESIAVASKASQRALALASVRTPLWSSFSSSLSSRRQRSRFASSFTALGRVDVDVRGTASALAATHAFALIRFSFFAAPANALQSPRQQPIGHVCCVFPFPTLACR